MNKADDAHLDRHFLAVEHGNAAPVAPARERVRERERERGGEKEGVGGRKRIREVKEREGERDREIEDAHLDRHSLDVDHAATAHVVPAREFKF